LFVCLSFGTDPIINNKNRKGKKKKQQIAAEEYSAMEVSAGLVAGSHNRNELVVIRRDGESAVSSYFSFPTSSFSSPSTDPV
jgi:hypothetical protein